MVIRKMKWGSSRREFFQPMWCILITSSFCWMTTYFVGWEATLWVILMLHSQLRNEHVLVISLAFETRSLQKISVPPDLFAISEKYNQTCTIVAHRNRQSRILIGKTYLKFGAYEYKDPLVSKYWSRKLLFLIPARNCLIQFSLEILILYYWYRNH